MFDEIGCTDIGAYRLIIISFSCIFPFINMTCPFLFCLANISLKTTLSDVNIATPDFFFRPIGLVNIPPAFHPKKPVLISVNKMGLL
jgi:hypothetical protein